VEKHSTTYCLDGLCCSEEEQLIQKKLRSVAGVEDVHCNIVSNTVVIGHTCSHDVLIRALGDIGFSPRQNRNSPTENVPRRWNDQIFLTSVAGILLAAGLVLHVIGVSSMIEVALFLSSMVAGGWRIAVRAIKGLQHGSIDMNVLMTVAAIGASAIDRWAEGAAVIVLFSVSQALERFSVHRARNAIDSLLKLSPPTATIKINGKETIVTVEEIPLGALVVVRPGERIPVDGIVRSGGSDVNQSVITGESVSVSKLPGDYVYAGTLNERGMLEVEVTKRPEDSTLARIVRMVEENQNKRAPIQQLTEKFARYYSPAVIGIAVLIPILGPILTHDSFGVWFYRSLVMLVIACPCALVISTPVTIVSALSHAARQGILIKGGKYLEEIGRAKVIAFDKTGTLTEGFPHVTDVIPLNSLSPDEILRITAVIENGSEHHLAGAVIREIRHNEFHSQEIDLQNFAAIGGRGVTASIDGTKYIVGNHALVEEQGICSATVEQHLHRLETEGKTCLVLGTTNEVLGIIGIADTLRADAPLHIQNLRLCGIQRIVMITGDNAGTAKSIARQIGITETHANAFPEEKVNYIHQLRKTSSPVVMVGDGVNDAPALAAANIGIGMGRSGTDIVLETADIVLMTDDLSKISYLIRLSRKTRSIIAQNITIAVVMKLVFLVMGLSGIASLWLAVLADDGATLVVILNGLRALRKLKDEKAIL